jgi:hypothetical protein
VLRVLSYDAPQRLTVDVLIAAAVKTLTGHGLEKKGVQTLSSDFDGINEREHDGGTGASYPTDTLTSMKKETQRP